MTAQPAYYRDSYQKQIDTRIASIDEGAIFCEDTLFYPEGGGQPGDTGTISNESKTIAVVDSKKQNGTIAHLVTDASGFAVGDEVTLNLDWDRRYAHMRMHTAMHLLGSLIPVPVTGGSVGAEKSRLDFDLGEHQIDKIQLTDQMNALIEQDHPVSFSEITDEELDANPDLVRTMSVQPPRGSGVIRMVTIEGVDYQPCGGTHLNRVGEIGKVLIKKIENKGKKNRRVHLVFAD